MYAIKSLIACLTAAVALPAIAQSTPAKAPSPVALDLPLVVDGNVRVDVADFEGNILRLPEDKRAGFRFSYDRVAAVVDNVYIARALGQRARDAGLDKDPAVQARLAQLQDAYLADLYVQKIEKDTTAAPNLDSRARELYVADREKYLTDEEVQVHQILVGVVCRTKESANDIARQAYAEAKGGQDFLALAAKYSDVGEKAYKGGDIGWGPVKKLVEPVRAALAKMKKGEISEPVESPFGIHVLKLIDRKPPTQKPFDSVKAEIVAVERAKLQRKRVEDMITSVRSSGTVVTYRENVEKLVAPGIDIEELTQKARDAHRTPAARPDAAKK